MLKLMQGDSLKLLCAVQNNKMTAEGWLLAKMFGTPQCRDSSGTEFLRVLGADCKGFPRCFRAGGPWDPFQQVGEEV